MTININNLNNQNQVHQNKQAQVKQTAQADNNAQVKQVARDSVSLTPQAQQFKELQSKAASAPLIDQKKVEELKKAISSGEYKVDADKLMKSMLAYEFDLLES